MRAAFGVGARVSGGQGWTAYKEEQGITVDVMPLFGVYGSQHLFSAIYLKLNADYAWTVNRPTFRAGIGFSELVHKLF